MTLLSAFLEIAAGWRTVFPQSRTFQRAVRQALGSLVCLGRRCLSRIIWANGGQNRSWGAEYFLHSRCEWQPQELFRPILQRALAYCPGRLVGVAVDDTRLPKTGRCIQQAFYQRDPLSPPFHVNLMLGLRFLQASLLVPTHRLAPVSTRGLPIRFEEVSRVKKPSRKAKPEAWQEYKEAIKQHNLSQSFVRTMGQLRLELDLAGGEKKILVCWRRQFLQSHLLPRAARSHRVDLPHSQRCGVVPAGRGGGRRFYGAEKFTPDQVRQDETRPWRQTKVFYGGKWRKVRYKEVSVVYWQGGAGRCPLRLLVVAPTPYRKRKSSKLYYRQPASYSPPISKTLSSSCCRSISTVGRSKSITGMKKTH